MDFIGKTETFGRFKRTITVRCSCGERVEASQKGSSIKVGKVLFNKGTSSTLRGRERDGNETIAQNYWTDGRKS
jgi:hypothetical protein